MSQTRSRLILSPAQLLAAIERISRSRSLAENYRSFCEASYCALAKRTAPTAERADALEARYMSVVKGYGDEKHASMAKIKELFHQVKSSVSASGEDLLGRAYMEAGMGNSRLGQEFTPVSITRLLNKLCENGESQLRANVEAILAEGRLVTVLDCCCGSGGMILEFADQLRMAGFDPRLTMVADMMDIDPLCTQMAFVQAEVLDLPAVVTQGDTLTLDVHEHSHTTAFVRAALRLARSRTGQSPRDVYPSVIGSADSIVRPDRPAVTRPSETGERSQASRPALSRQGDLFSD
jgi:hypothetical protein